MWNKLQKLWGDMEGILRQVLEILTDESLCLHQIYWLYWFRIQTKLLKKKKYKKLCFFFFIYLLVMKRKNKQKKFTKKSKKKTWNFIFYWYIEIDHSGWSKKIRYENNSNIVHIYSERHTIPRFDCVSFYLLEIWNDKCKKKIWNFETW